LDAHAGAPEEVSPNWGCVSKKCEQSVGVGLARSVPSLRSWRTQVAELGGSHIRPLLLNTRPTPYRQQTLEAVMLGAMQAAANDITVPNWLRGLFNKKSTKDRTADVGGGDDGDGGGGGGAYAEMTAKLPSTVSLFAAPGMCLQGGKGGKGAIAAKAGATAELAVPGRGGPCGSITHKMLTTLLTELDKAEIDRVALLEFELLRKVLSAFEAPPIESAESKDAKAQAKVQAAAAAAAAPAAAGAGGNGADMYDDYYDEDDVDPAGPADATYWAKGTGFGFGSTGVAWNRAEWEAEQTARAEYDIVALKCTARVLEMLTEEAPPKDIALDIARALAESKLPSVLVELLATDSMVDIARRRANYTAAVSVLQAIAADATVFAAVDDHAQCATVSSTLVRTWKRLNKVMIQEKEKSLMEMYRKTARLVRERRAAATTAAAAAVAPVAEAAGANDVAKTDVAEAAPVAEPAQKLDYCSVLAAGQFGEAKFETHFYLAEAKAAGDPPAQCMERIVQELGSLATSLPLHEGSSVFLRYDPDQMNLMKALITGPEDTPYSGGCFEFDIFFPNSFPTSPPKVSLITTGNGSVRFNPNLYNSGKVCLSILGTWPGRPEEQWGPHCTLLQVLTSIQSLVFVEEPYYNEPGYERSRGTPHGDKMCHNYSRGCQKNALKWAMVNKIVDPGPAFADVVKAHFLLKRGVVDVCTKWEVVDHAKKAEHAMEEFEKQLKARKTAEAAKNKQDAERAAAGPPANKNKARINELEAQLEQVRDKLLGAKGKGKKKCVARVKTLQEEIAKVTAAGLPPAPAAVYVPPMPEKPAAVEFKESADLVELQKLICKIEKDGLPAFADATAGDDDDDDWDFEE